MRDLKLVISEDRMAGDLGLTYPKDYSIAHGDLTIEEGLETAILVSLFTDRRAGDDDALLDPDSDSRRGWWGDLVSPVEERDRLGSRLWLLDRSKVTQEVVNAAKNYIEEALEWMLIDKVAVKIEVNAEAKGPVENRMLAFHVRIFYRDGLDVSEYNLQWEAMI